MGWKIALLAAKLQYIQEAISTCVEMLEPLESLSDEERIEREADGLPTENPHSDEIADEIFFCEDEMDICAEELLDLAVEV